jgi:hypothetical protein
VVKIVKNGRKWSKLVGIGQNIDQNFAKNGQKDVKTVDFVQKWSKIGPKFVGNVQKLIES